MSAFSKFLSLVLRHNPAAARISLDENGWANIDDLLAGCRHAGFFQTRAALEIEVETNGKKRFELNPRRTHIRASQGHSIPVDTQPTETRPPEFLYHGTSVNNLPAIQSEGLKPMRRLHVHLSGDPETARNVGSRHGRPVVLRINAEEVARTGHKFYISANKVWLTSHIAPQDITIL